MGLEELLQTLRKNEQQKIDEIWQAARNEAEKLRQEVADAKAAITQKHEEKLASACRRSMRAIFSEAAAKTRKKRLLIFCGLADKLRETATRQLPLLRGQDYDAVFAKLSGELPEARWEQVVVNPADHERASRLFGADVIRTDPALSGGLVAVTADKRVTVENSFEIRLERKWPDMLPALLAELEKRYGNTGTAENGSAV